MPNGQHASGHNDDAVNVISLLTDFGGTDSYVGQMKGTILTIAPSATLVDITHAVPPQDVQAGAFLLWTAVAAFPAGTVHLAVVDPGVGSPRRAIAMQTGRGDFLVGPDNGLLMPAAEHLGGLQTAVELRVPEQASTTFHGRDVFAPAAARLAIGTALADLGASVTDLVEFALPVPSANLGEVIHIDTYGNLVTNFPQRVLEEDFEVQIGDRLVSAAPYYAAVEPGALVALVGSAGLLEISARDASAAAITGARRGTNVSLVSRRPRQE